MKSSVAIVKCPNYDEEKVLNELRRSLRGGAKAQVLLAGKIVEGRGQVIEEQKAVAQSLFEYYSKIPKVAKYVQIGLDAAGKPIVADCERAAQKMVVVRIDLM